MVTPGNTSPLAETFAPALRDGVNFLTRSRTALAEFIAPKGALAVVEERGMAPAGYTEAQWMATLAQMQMIGGGLGVTVTPLKALGVATVFACVRVIADSVASLPVSVRRRVGDSITSVPSHPLNDLLGLAPNAEMSAFDLMFAANANLALRGNGYIEILRNAYGDTVEMWPTPAEQVRIGRDAQRRLVYRINNKDIPAANVVHVKGVTFNGLVGADLPTYLREVFALAIALQEHGVNFFANGANPGVHFDFPADPSQETKDEIKKGWEEKHSGPRHAGKPLVTGGGVKVNFIRGSQKDAEFEASRKTQDLQICQAFGVPPYKIGLAEGGPKSSAEQAGIEFVNATILPLTVKWAQALTARALTPEERADGHFIAFDLRALLRGDAAARGAYLKTMVESGIFNVDEAREEEGKAPLPNDEGKIYRVPLNTVSAEDLKTIQKTRTTAGAA